MNTSGTFRTWESMMQDASIAFDESMRVGHDAYRLLTRLASATWGDTLALRTRTVMRWYPLFIRLAANYPAADIDALITVPRRLFGVTARTIRADVKTAGVQTPPPGTRRQTAAAAPC